jgi:drug/metabolite transporter (DMT)-like permease
MTDQSATGGWASAAAAPHEGSKPAIPTKRRLGLALIVASAIAWSTAGYFTRLIPLDAWTLQAWRGLFAGIGILIIGATLHRRPAPRLSLGRAGWLYALVGAATMVSFIASLTLTSVAHVSIVYATVPLVAAVLGWLILRERPKAFALAASAAAFAGVVMTAGLSAEGGWLGDLLALAMTFGMASLMIIARRFPTIPALPACAISAFAAALACWPFGHPLTVSSRDLVLLALFGFTQSALGNGLFSLGARYLPAVETALIGALDAPLAPLWVFLAFGETPGVATFAGGLVVFAAVGTYLAVGAGASPFARRRHAGRSPSTRHSAPNASA